MSLLVESIYFEKSTPKHNFEQHARESFLHSFSVKNETTTNNNTDSIKFKEVINTIKNQDTNDQLDKNKSGNPIVAILLHIYIDKESIKNENNLIELINEKSNIIKELRDRELKSFIVAYIDYSSNKTVDEQFPIMSSRLFNSGCSLVTNRIEDVIESLNKIESTSITQSGLYSCPICSEYNFAINLSHDNIIEHYFLFHGNLTRNNIENPIVSICPICKEKPTDRMGAHLHESHMTSTQPPPFKKVFVYCLVVVKKISNSSYLLVNEAADRGYWLPGGKIDIGESLQKCAIRETKEETGIDIELKGILRIQFMPVDDYFRLKVTFYAEPIDENQPPRLIPNCDSMGAMYAKTKDLQSLKLRGKEPIIWFNYLDQNKPIHSLSLLDEPTLPIL